MGAATTLKYFTFNFFLKFTQRLEKVGYLLTRLQSTYLVLFDPLKNMINVNKVFISL